MHTPKNISSVNVSWVEHILVFNMLISWNIHVSQYVFLADVNIGKMFVNVPKTQYNIFNKPTCLQNVRVTAYKATV